MSETLAPPTPVESDANDRRGAHSLLPGTVIGGRFRILRLLGRGGTGEVYEAEDTVLRTPVAVKVLRPEAATAQARERLRREVLLARRVTHPNVCRVFDLYEHDLRDAASEITLSFLTMELLHGETLTARLSRQGALPRLEALPLARQMAAALDAAHRAHVVHRDFKSANVVLVAEPGGGTRAVVTDFGLARALEVDDTSSSRSVPLVGTCAYMSPEQVEGGEVGAAADIYALGIVLYEMVTARRPFRADTALATALLRMHEPPVPPSRYVPDLDARWEAVILRCLARDPGARFPRPEDVATALSESGAGPRAARAAPRSRGGAVVLTLAAATTLAAMVVRPPSPWNRPATTPAGTARPPAPRRTAVALVGFNNLSGRPETEWLSTALAEMLRTELSLAGKVHTIPGESVARMKMELALRETDSLAGDTLSRVRANVGADYVVLGSYLALGREMGGRIRVELRVQDAATGETTVALTETGTESDLFDLVTRLGARMRKGLGAPGDVSTAEIRTAAALPAESEALRLYAEGLSALRRLDGRTAVALLQRAVKIEPASALVRAGLAQAWTTVGSDQHAREEAEKAFTLSGSLPEEERRWVEGLYRESIQDWSGAARAYGALWASFPDRDEYGLRLAAAQTSGGTPRDAVATLTTLRGRSGTGDKDPRVDIAEAEASHALGDFERARQLAVRGGANGARHSARLLVARARIQEARALERLGDLGQAAARFAEAQRLFAATGDGVSVSWTNVYLGLVRFTQGEPEEARALFTRALDEFDEIGHRRGHAAAASHLMMVHWKQGRHAEAKALAEDAMATLHELGDKAGIARASNNLAVLAQTDGDLDGARRLYDQSLAMARQVGNKAGVAVTLINVGDVAAEQGDLRAAEKIYEESLALVKAINLKARVSRCLSGLADLRLNRGDLDGARAGHDQARGLRVSLGEKLGVAESDVALGRLALEEARPAAAERAARSALAEFRREQARDDEALARALLVSALAAQGRTGAARDEGGRARELAESSQSQQARLAVGLAVGRVEAMSEATAESARGRRQLEAVLAEARKSGRRGLEMETRLALLQARKASDRSGAILEAAALEKEATALGFGLLARKAAAVSERVAATAPPQGL